MDYTAIGITGIELPPIIFGTSCFGNLYEALPRTIKINILKEIFSQMNGRIVLDSAGKYGAGLALESIGKGLRELDIPGNRVVISNKLGWYRVPLKSAEPTFEPGVWSNIKHDAVQKINYSGILECWEQGCELLGDEYHPEIVSVHDPDEYLMASTDKHDRTQRLDDIINAYRALSELKTSGKVKAIGIGAKDWKVIREITRLIDLDWIMPALSFTIFNHPPEILDFLDELHDNGILIINSAVFHAGFLTGGKYFDYRILDLNKDSDRPYFEWRDRFFKICKIYQVKPADACVQFGMSHPGVSSIALNTSKPERVLQNIESVQTIIPNDFWRQLKIEGLIAENYPYLE